MTIPDDGRDQALTFSSAERGYLIDAMMVFLQSVDDLPAESQWHWKQRQELQVLLEHLMRTDRHSRHRLLGEQVTVVLDRECPGISDDGEIPGSPPHESAVTSGRLLGFGEEGTFEVLEDDGFIHYCWPMLEIRERDEKGDQHRREGQG